MSDKPEEKCKRRTEALRPFRPHNNTCDFVLGYDRESVEKAIKAKDARIAELERDAAGLVEALEMMLTTHDPYDWPDEQKRARQVLSAYRKEQKP